MRWVHSFSKCSAISSSHSVSRQSGQSRSRFEHSNTRWCVSWYGNSVTPQKFGHCRLTTAQSVRRCASSSLAGICCPQLHATNLLKPTIRRRRQDTRIPRDQHKNTKTQKIQKYKSTRWGVNDGDMQFSTVAGRPLPREPTGPSPLRSHHNPGSTLSSGTRIDPHDARSTSHAAIRIRQHQLTQPNNAFVTTSGVRKATTRSQTNAY